MQPLASARENGEVARPSELRRTRRARAPGPFAVFEILWRHREIVWQMSKREVLSRYRGSTLGLLWSFLQPLALLAIYTFVFGVVFQARWGMPIEHRGEFALVLFAGLIVYALFAECVVRAPGLVVNQPTYVKKVVFPLDVLPWVAMGSALFHAAVSTSVLLLGHLVLRGPIPWTILTLPLVLAPCVLHTMGLSWFLASLGVYFRDTAQMVGLFTTAVLFLSPVFYPVSALPERLRGFLWLNPLTYVIEDARAALFAGQAPDWPMLVLSLGLGLAVAWAGLAWFERTRAGFADVV